MRAALQERISLGTSKEDIVNELVSAGYTREESTDLYNQVAVPVSDNSPKEPASVPVVKPAPAISAHWSAPSKKSPVKTSPETLPSVKKTATTFVNTKQENNTEALSVTQSKVQSAPANPGTENVTKTPTPSLVQNKVKEVQADKPKQIGTETISSSAVPPAAPSVPKAAAEKVADDTTKTKSSKPTSGRNWGLEIVGASIVLLLGLAILVFVTGWYRPILSSLGFSVAPYDEVTLLPGLMLQAANTDRAQVETNFSLVLEQPDASVPVGDDELFEFLQMILFFSGLGLPEEAHLKINSSATVDNRVSSDARFNLQTEADLLFEPFTFRLGGTVRRAEDVLYGRIDRLPPVMTTALQSEGVTVPIGEWVVLPSNEEDYAEFFGPMFLQPMLLPAPSTNTPNFDPMSSPQLFLDTTEPLIFTRVASHLWTGLTNFSEQVVTQAERPSVFGMTASLGELFVDNLLPGFVPERERAELAQGIDLGVDLISRAWQRYPLIEFVTTPYQVVDNGESVYVYEIRPATSNIEPFLRHLIAETEADPNLELVINTAALEDFLENDTEELIAGLEAAEQFYDMRVHVRPDGSLQALLLEAAIRSGLQSFPHQFRLQMHARYTAEFNVPNIEIPSEVYEKTLLEMIQEPLTQSQNEIEDTIIQLELSSLRTRAQLYYNENDFSYVDFCDSEYVISSGFDNSLQQAEQQFWCHATNNRFSIMSALSDGSYYCVTNNIANIISGDDTASTWQQCISHTD